MKQGPKIVVLSSRFPFPMEKGDKLRLFHQIRLLSESFQIHLIALSDIPVSTNDEWELRAFCESISIVEFKSPSNIQVGLQSLRTQLPLQTCYFFDKKIKLQIHSILDRLKPEIIYTQLVRMAPYVWDRSEYKVIDMMDAMSLNMQHESRISSFPKSMMYSRESKLLLKMERLCIEKFDKATIISNRDKQFIQQSEDPNFHVIHNGVDLDYFCNDLNAEQPYDIAFVGNMGYQPNIDAAVYLIEKVINPHLPHLKVLISGARPSLKIQKLASKHVHVTGWVDDIRDAYASCKLIVAPLFSGSGQQNKILEAMSMSKACVTTTVVNNSLHARPDEQIMIADSPEEFVEKIERLLNNTVLREEIGRSGRTFVQQNFEWNHQVQKLKDILSPN